MVEREQCDISQEDAGEATARPYLEYRSEKNLSPKKVHKSLWKKSERARKASQRQLCIMHSLCTINALIMHLK